MIKIVSITLCVFLWIGGATAWGEDVECTLNAYFDATDEMIKPCPEKQSITVRSLGLNTTTCIVDGDGITCRTEEGPCAPKHLFGLLKKAEQFLPEEICPPNTICLEDYTLRHDVDIRSAAQKLRDQADEIEQREKDTQAIRSGIATCEEGIRAQWDQKE